MVKNTILILQGLGKKEILYFNLCKRKKSVEYDKPK
jgi:hypothetical protein